MGVCFLNRTGAEIGWLLTCQKIRKNHFLLVIHFLFIIQIADLSAHPAGVRLDPCVQPHVPRALNKYLNHYI